MYSNRLNMVTFTLFDSCEENKTNHLGIWDMCTKTLTLTKLWANSADDKLMIFFLFFPENRL